MSEKKIHLVINQQGYDLELEPRKLLSDVIRDDCFLTGTHVGCEHGVCGACTILVDGKLLRSCLVYGVQMDGKHIETIESIGTHKKLSRFQQAMHEEHGLQCGYCTAGIVMTIEGLLRENPKPSEMEIQDALTGNLCRCTGYQNILRAIQRVLLADQEKS
jgi:aerobic carbon-monoxide dehydrogenase small subunit